MLSYWNRYPLILCSLMTNLFPTMKFQQCSMYIAPYQVNIEKYVEAIAYFALIPYCSAMSVVAMHKHTLWEHLHEPSMAYTFQPTPPLYVVASTQHAASHQLRRRCCTWLPWSTRRSITMSWRKSSPAALILGETSTVSPHCTVIV